MISISKLKAKPLILWIILIVQIATLLCVFGVTEIDLWAYVGLFECIATVAIIILMGHGIISMPMIFCILLYVFHASHFLLDALKIEYTPPLDMHYFLTEEAQLFSIRFTCVALVAYALGVMLFSNPVFPKNRRSPHVLISVEFCKTLGKSLLVLCVLPRIYVDISLLIAYLQSGYAGTFEVATSGILQMWADGFYVAGILLLIGYRDTPWCKGIFSAFLVYSVFAMICGRRQEKVSFIVALLIVFFKFASQKKLRVRTVAFMSIGAYFFLVCLATFGDVRGYETFAFSVLLETFIKNLAPTFLIDQLAEFGGTVMTLGFSYMSFPEYVPFNYGLTYIISWIQILPNVGSFLNEIMGNMDYVKFMPDQYQLWLGGSCLGELYYNFGFWGALGMLPVGGLVSNISTTMDRDMKKGFLSMKSIAGLLIMAPMVLWVRGVFLYFVRPLVWYSILIYLIYFVWHRIKR